VFLCVPSLCLVSSLPEEGRVRKAFHQAKPGLKTRKGTRERQMQQQTDGCTWSLLPGVCKSVSSERDTSVRYAQEAGMFTLYTSSVHTVLGALGGNSAE